MTIIKTPTELENYLNNKYGNMDGDPRPVFAEAQSIAAFVITGFGVKSNRGGFGEYTWDNGNPNRFSFYINRGEDYQEQN